MWPLQWDSTGVTRNTAWPIFSGPWRFVTSQGKWRRTFLCTSSLSTSSRPFCREVAHRYPGEKYWIVLDGRELETKKRMADCYLSRRPDFKRFRRIVGILNLPQAMVRRENPSDRFFGREQVSLVPGDFDYRRVPYRRFLDHLLEDFEGRRSRFRIAFARSSLPLKRTPPHKGIDWGIGCGLRDQPETAGHSPDRTRVRHEPDRADCPRARSTGALPLGADGRHEGHEPVRPSGLPEWGGAGMDTISYAITIEELARVCAGIALAVTVHNSVSLYPIEAYGTDEQKRRILPGMCSGDRVGAFCVTEPNAGSDASATETTAILDGDRYILNGNKIWVTNGAIAGVAVVLARTDPEDKKRGLSTLIVERGMRGFSVGPLEDLCGMRSNPVSSLIMTDCPVPKENLLGRPGDGVRIALATLDVGRIGIASQALGIAQASLDVSLAYAQQRIQFRSPLTQFQSIQNMLADTATEIEAARLLVYQAGCCATTSGPSPLRRPWPSFMRVRRPAAPAPGGCRSTEGTATRRAIRSSATGGMPA